MQQLIALLLTTIIFFISVKYLVLFLSVVYVSLYDAHKAKKDTYHICKEESVNMNTACEAQQEYKSSEIKVKLNRVYNMLYRYLSWKVSTIPSMRLRIFLYKHVFHMEIAPNVTIHFKTEIRCGYRIHIGEGSVIGDNCLLDGRRGIFIGENVNVSSNASIYTLQHNVNSSDFSGTGGPVIIRDRAWISSNTVVLPNTTVDEGAVLACGAVATKDMEAFSIYAGIPAKKVANRSKKLSYSFSCSYDML